VPAFQVKLGANDLNCVDVPLNPTHSLTHGTVKYMNMMVKFRQSDDFCHYMDNFSNTRVV